MRLLETPCPPRGGPTQWHSIPNECNAPHPNHPVLPPCCANMNNLLPKSNAYVSPHYKTDIPNPLPSFRIPYRHSYPHTVIPAQAGIYPRIPISLSSPLSMPLPPRVNPPLAPPPAPAASAARSASYPPAYSAPPPGISPAKSPSSPPGSPQTPNAGWRPAMPPAAAPR